VDELTYGQWEAGDGEPVYAHPSLLLSLAKILRVSTTLLVVPPDAQGRHRIDHDLLGQLRTAAHLSVEQLADRSGLDPAAIHEIEMGNVDPSSEVVAVLAVALGIDPSLLSGIEPERHLRSSDGGRWLLAASSSAPRPPGSIRTLDAVEQPEEPFLLDTSRPVPSPKEASREPAEAFSPPLDAEMLTALSLMRRMSYPAMSGEDEDRYRVRTKWMFMRRQQGIPLRRAIAGRTAPGGSTPAIPSERPETASPHEHASVTRSVLQVLGLAGIFAWARSRRAARDSRDPEHHRGRSAPRQAANKPDSRQR